MSTIALPPLSSCGKPLDPSPRRLGVLRSSVDAVGDYAELRARFDAEGYLYIPGFFDREEVMEARMSVVRQLHAEGALDPAYDPSEAVAAPGVRMSFRPDLANNNPTIKGLVYSERVMAFYDGLLGGPSRHYDYTWLRAVAPGRSTQPHFDVVYMGRGTKRVCTAWTPLSDVTFEGGMGGLAILEGSHRITEMTEGYGQMDVDEFCENKPGVSRMEDAGYKSFGSFSDDPVDLAERFDLRWLTAEYRMGDLLTFSMFTLHASTDNLSNRIRLSTDSRYQLASEPVDERWVGENPPGHGGVSRRDLIC